MPKGLVALAVKLTFPATEVLLAGAVIETATAEGVEIAPCHKTLVAGLPSFHATITSLTES
jgi:hypothetical protein